MKALTPNTDPDSDSAMYSSPPSSSASNTHTPTQEAHLKSEDQLDSLPQANLTLPPQLVAEPTAESVLASDGTSAEFVSAGNMKVGPGTVATDQEYFGEGNVTVNSSGSVSTTLGAEEMHPTKPGALWNNKKAEAKYMKTLEFVVDQDFSLSKSPLWIPCVVTERYTEEFGDPFDEQRDQRL